jgi:hypothetical protein
MWRPLRIAAVLAAAGLLLSSLPAASEIYRWRDAEGREHFTTSLQQVPAAHRDAAKRAAEEAGGRVNYHTQPHRAAPAAKAAPSPAKAGEISQWDCSGIRREARKLQKVITYHRKKIATYERLAGDITLEDFTRRKYEVRAEESAAWLAKGEAAFDRFADEQRRKGVPPGCLRP